MPHTSSTCMHVIPNIFYIYHHDVALSIHDGYKLIRMSCFEQTDAPCPHSPTGQSPPTPQARAKRAETKRARGPPPPITRAFQSQDPSRSAQAPGGETGRNQKGLAWPMAPPTLHPGPPKPRPKPVGPGPGPPHPPPPTTQVLNYGVWL
jgi:hypothetical protein